MSLTFGRDAELDKWTGGRPLSTHSRPRPLNYEGDMWDLLGFFGAELPYAVVEWADARWGRGAAWAAAFAMIFLPMLILGAIIFWFAHWTVTISSDRHPALVC